MCKFPAQASGKRADRVAIALGTCEPPTTTRALLINQRCLLCWRVAKCLKAVTALMLSAQSGAVLRPLLRIRTLCSSRWMPLAERHCSCAAVSIQSLPCQCLTAACQCNVARVATIKFSLTTAALPPRGKPCSLAESQSISYIPLSMGDSSVLSAIYLFEKMAETSPEHMNKLQKSAGRGCSDHLKLRPRISQHLSHHNWDVPCQSCSS